MEGLDELLERYKIPLALSLVGIVLIIGGIFASGVGKSSKSVSAKSFPKESLVSTPPQLTQLKIDISGAVENPGVYTLTPDSRVEDALKSAGGIKTEANQEYISKSLNLSQKLSDGMKIYVPFQGEVSGGVVAGVSTSSQGSTIGINSATPEGLDSLPGVGPVTAQKIISGRPYQSLDDLVNKKVVSKSVFEKIKDQIDLN